MIYCCFDRMTLLVKQICCNTKESCLNIIQHQIPGQFSFITSRQITFCAKPETKFKHHIVSTQTASKCYAPEEQKDETVKGLLSDSGELILTECLLVAEYFVGKLTPLTAGEPHFSSITQGHSCECSSRITVPFNGCFTYYEASLLIAHLTCMVVILHHKSN